MRARPVAGSHTGNRPTQAPALVIIDMQTVFGNPSSEWFTPRFADASAVIQRLLPAFGERVILTRFVPPVPPAGGWVTFYREWRWALVPDTDPLYDLVPPFGDSGYPTVTETTFSKWGTALEQALEQALGEGGEMVLTGVATDCCVLSTALAAADAGVRVRVVADGCAGSTDANHQRALDVMAGWGPPLIDITDSAAVLANLT